MLLSAFMVKTLTLLVEPPPAIGGIPSNKAQLPLGKVQPQANIGVFMFLFMLCAFEVVFIKLISYVTRPGESVSIGTQTSGGAGAGVEDIRAQSVDARSATEVAAAEQSS